MFVSIHGHIYFYSDIPEIFPRLGLITHVYRGFPAKPKRCIQF